MYLYLKGTTMDKWSCCKTEQRNSTNTGEWHEKSTEYNQFPPSLDKPVYEGQRKPKLFAVSCSDLSFQINLALL